MYKRALALHKQRAAYLKDIAEGKTRPFPDVVANWEYYKSQVSDLKKMYQSYLAEDSSNEKADLTTPLLLAIQPVGQWLDNAEHSSSVQPPVTAEEMAEHKRLQKSYQETELAGPKGKMRIVSPGHFYTLKHLPIPIKFNGPPETEVILFSELGGVFTNGHTYISITTDDKGLASTSWVSEGDAVATCNILYRSNELPDRGRISVQVKRLSLLPLEDISPIAESTEQKLKKSHLLNK